MRYNEYSKRCILYVRETAISVVADPISHDSTILSTAETLLKAPELGCSMHNAEACASLMSVVTLISVLFPIHFPMAVSASLL